MANLNTWRLQRGDLIVATKDNTYKTVVKGGVYEITGIGEKVFSIINEKGNTQYISFEFWTREFDKTDIKRLPNSFIDIGDKLIYINKRSHSSYFTSGKTYKVLNSNKLSFVVSTDFVDVSQTFSVRNFNQYFTLRDG